GAKVLVDYSNDFGNESICEQIATQQINAGSKVASFLAGRVSWKYPDTGQPNSLLVEPEQHTAHDQLDGASPVLVRGREDRRAEVGGGLGDADRPGSAKAGGRERPQAARSGRHEDTPRSPHRCGGSRTGGESVEAP